LGTTACPCAQEILKEQVQRELAKLGVSEESAIEFSERMPIATHNQRGRGSISVEVHDRRCVSIDRIIKIIEESMSAKVYGLLKRPDEAVVVARAHSNPKFVEDCVRAMAKNLVERFPDLSDDTTITIKQVNEESIHRHNAFAERYATFGELKKEVNGKAPVKATDPSKPVAVKVGHKKAKV